MVLRVGTSSGIYTAARDQELYNAIRKVGYTLTKGVATMEISVDISHEVNYTHGKTIRRIANKQGVQLNLHGDLQVPFCIPERGEWRDAQDRVKNSIRSAVLLGAHYVNFHACLNTWLELISYGPGLRKLTMALCDSEGEFISELLHRNEHAREWFIKKRGDIYLNEILNRDENIEVSTRINVETDRWRREETDRRIRGALEPLRGKIESMFKEEALERLAGRDSTVRLLLSNPSILKDPNLPPGERAALLRAQNKIQAVRGNADDFIQAEVDGAFLRGIPRKTGDSEIDSALENTYSKLREDTAMESSKIRDRIVDNFLREKMTKKDIAGRHWYHEELRTPMGIVDGYHLMSHFLYWTQDPIWVAMTKQYEDVLKRYKYKTGDPEWLEEAWKKAETENDREYKEFFFAAVGAKYLEGHLKKAFEWLYNEFIPKELPRMVKDPKEREELAKIAKDIIIGLENPDARETAHGGLYFLFRYKQIYAAVKTIRETLKTDKVMMVVDHEHTATHGVDSLLESRSDILPKPDFGKLTIACHANHPNPLQPHAPLELGDVVLYELLYNLKVTGFGADQTGYLVFERGGGQDPFVHSIDTLRLMTQFLETKPPTPVNKLPLEFFGMKGLTGGDVQRQMQIVQDHAWEPMKDLLEIPEEEWTMLSQTAIKKGKKPEIWKKGEAR